MSLPSSANATQSKPFFRWTRRGRGVRRKPGEMNGLETSYSKHLDELLRDEKIQWWLFDSLKFRIAQTCFYTPDFVVMMPDDTIELHEVKGGFWEDDARVKIKAAADKFPFRFIAISRKAKKDGGGWAREEF